MDFFSQNREKTMLFAIGHIALALITAVKLAKKALKVQGRVQQAPFTLWLSKLTYCVSHVLVQPNFQRLFFTFCPIKLKLTSIISTFQSNSSAKFHSNPTKGKYFRHKPPMNKSPAFGNAIMLTKAGNFYNRGLQGNSSSSVESG